MLIYATVRSERAMKGQGGEWLDIEITDENKEEIARIQVRKEDKYTLNVFPVAYPDKLAIDVKGHGYKVKIKGNKQKDEMPRKATDGEWDEHN